MVMFSNQQKGVEFCWLLVVVEVQMLQD